MPTNENLKLTIDELKRIKGYESVNEEQALTIIENIFTVSILAFNAYKKELNVM